MFRTWFVFGPILGHIHLTQSLLKKNFFYISCSLLNTVLKVKSETGCLVTEWSLSVLVVYPCDHMADWELLPRITNEVIKH